MKKLTMGALCSVLLLAGCSAEKDDWRAAQAADTSLAYGHFVSQHPDSSHAAEARSRAAALVATEAAAMTAGDTPASAVVSPALADAAVPEPVTAPVSAPVPVAVPAAQALATPVAPAPVVPVPLPAVAPTAAALAAAPPTAAPPVAKLVPAKSAGYGVQIGAFSTQAKAEAQWQAIEKRFRRELAGSSHQIAAGKAGSKVVFRLKVPQPSQAAAKALCGRLAAGGQSCVVYHP